MLAIPFMLCCFCCGSSDDFKTEVDTQIYQITQEIEEVEIDSQNLYDLGYLKGKLDVYKSLQEGINQNPPQDTSD
jgi:hypothetical protein